MIIGNVELDFLFCNDICKLLSAKIGLQGRWVLSCNEQAYIFSPIPSMNAVDACHSHVHMKDANPEQ